METWYRIRKYREDIQPVTVVKATEKQVVTLEPFLNNGFREVRQAKFSEYESYFPTWDKAYAAIRERLQRKIAYCRKEISDAELALKNLEALNEKSGL